MKFIYLNIEDDYSNATMIGFHDHYEVSMKDIIEEWVTKMQFVKDKFHVYCWIDKNKTVYEINTRVTRDYTIIDKGPV